MYWIDTVRLTSCPELDRVERERDTSQPRRIDYSHGGLQSNDRSDGHSRMVDSFVHRFDPWDVIEIQGVAV